MGVRGVRAFVLALAASAGVLSALGTAAGPPPAKVRLAFVHAGGKDAGDFERLLDGAGFAVDLVAVRDAPGTSFSRYAAVLIGPGTQGAWGDGGRKRGRPGERGGRPPAGGKRGGPGASPAGAIERARVPVLGGAAFFERLGLPIGMGHVWHGSRTAVLPVDPRSSPVWSRLKVPPKEGRPFEVYEETGHVGVHVDGKAAGLGPIGRGEKSATHFPLIGAGPGYVLWGFQAGPGRMTDGGKELFIAVCRHAAGLERPKSRRGPTRAAPR